MTLDYYNIVVRLKALPPTVKAFVSTSPDGWHNIYINENLTHEQQNEALWHEVNHIRNQDFYSGKNLDSIES